MICRTSFGSINVEQEINKRFSIKPRTELIIHTDRVTQFTSKEYSEFMENQKGFAVGSMSRANTPKDNPVAKRFIRTFKEHRNHFKF